MTRIIVFALILLNAVLVYGQQTESISEVRKNDYQVELGFNSIESIYSNTSSATVLFKKKYQRGRLIEVNSVKYLRTFFTFNGQVNFSDDPTQASVDSTDVRFHPSSITNLTVGLGLEKQFQSNRFVHYYGLDFFTSYFKTNDDFENGSFGNIIVNSTNSTDRRIRTIESGFNPFIGIKYYFTPQFSVGMETGISLSYFNTRFQEIRFASQFDQDLGTFIRIVNELPPATSHGLKFRFLGVRFLTIGYSF
jgi:hypothetical protein